MLGSWAKEIAQEIVSNLAEIRRIILELKISDPILWCKVSAKLQTPKTVTMLTLKSHVPKDGMSHFCLRIIVSSVSLSFDP